MADARPRTETPRRAARRRLVAGIAIGAVLATVATVAVVADGFDAQEVPRLEPAVWVMRDAGQYARVNTDLAEIDTVRSADDPDQVVQSGADGVVLTQGLRRAWTVDGANPSDLVEAAGDDAGAATGTPTPAGTRTVVSSGRVMGYLTDTGQAFVATLPEASAAGGESGAGAAPIPLDPYAARGESEDDEETYVAAAIAVAPDGRVALYSAVEGAVRVWDPLSGDFAGDPVALDSPPSADAALEFAFAGEEWVLSEPAESRIWTRSRPDPAATGLPEGARLQASTDDAVLHIASSEGLSVLDVAASELDEVQAASGVPAAPVEVGDEIVAAWIDASGGALWTSSRGLVELSVDGDELDQVDQVAPVLQTNGDRAVLNETGSGMLWNVPDGRLIPIAQWTRDDEDDERDGEIDVEDVAEQEPPVAEPDVFGVRAGALVRLPVLLNDHDPNRRDVLTIVPDSVSGLSDPGFGDLQLVSQNQELVVQVHAAAGSASFTYAVTDGSAQSPPATVTLNVVAPDADSAPEWCGVEGCVQEWPSPAIAPGGTATVPVTTGWVDPEGDLFVLTDARAADPAAPVSVVATADGEVALRHTDPNAASSTIAVIVTITDSRGVAAERELVVAVRASPALEAKPVAVSAGVGEKVSVPIARYVSGGSGAMRLVDAVDTSSSAGGVQVVANASSGEVDLVASAPGEFQVTYSVEDTQTQSEESAIIRLSVADGARPLALGPQAAFVRPNEDTTVDVLGAVQNGGGRVLLVSEASTADAGLGVDVVGQSRVRVSGSTGDGRPGTIGTAQVTVTDGAGAETVGSLTVFLVEASAGVAPIAVPDTVSVRAGNQVDIPVTANDVSPRGERLVVHPEVHGSGRDDELVFASGGSLRYLAPSEPGRYTLRYSIYLENSPSRIDTSTVTVDVVPAGANRAPQPQSLTARVLSGQTVSIQVPTSGADPDGDRVVLADVTQPEAGQGVASISAQGDAIQYTAPADGVPGGQLRFTYTVRDPGGEEGTADVLVGVLARALTDNAPVAYSDYARVQAGSQSPVRVFPLRNDRDPSQGELELVSLEPNAPKTAGNPDYARLEALVDAATDLEQGEVVLRGGDVLGAHSYVYTVRSSVTSSTSQGLIVVNVTDAAAPEHPIVADTILTARDRAELRSGVDVVSSKVDWQSGDISQLKLSIWGAAREDYSVDGWRISGPVPERGALVPFELSGPDASGRETTAHGFLRIPAFDDMRVQLRSDADPVEVQEDSQVDVDLADLLDVDSRDRVELRSGARFAVQRANASCAPASGLTVRYAAGREAPWSDSCTVQVRIEGQQRWSALAVPLAVLPRDPQAILNSVSRTIAPGGSETIDLLGQMTTWEGGRAGDVERLDFRISSRQGPFIVTQAGSSVTIEARADALAGTRDSAQVSVTSFGGLAAAITLQVGVAPVDAPRGATFRTQCTVTRGSCSIPVTGVAGEYDPFQGKVGAGLQLQSVQAGGTAGCTVARVAVADARSVVATWPAGAKPIGGECSVSYTVADAQGRTGDGRVTIDVQGFPQAPASISTVAYTGSSVTLSVPLGEAAQAHPAVSGITIWEGAGQRAASCSPGAGAWTCVVDGLVNGEQHSFSARAVNSVGESDGTTAVRTWAYQAPEIRRLTADPAYVPGQTSVTTGVVRMRVESGADAQSFRIAELGRDVGRSGDATEFELQHAPGDVTFTVVPTSRFRPPIGDPSADGQAKTVRVAIAGAPQYTSSGTATAIDGTSLQLSGVALDANFSAVPGSERFVAWELGDAEPRCEMGGDRKVRISGGVQSATGAISGLREHSRYLVRACGSNGYGVAASQPHEVTVWNIPAPPAGPLTYTIGGQHKSSWDRGIHFFDEVSFSAVPAAPRNHVVMWNVNGDVRDRQPGGGHPALASAAGPPSISVAYCLDWDRSRCSEPTVVNAANAITNVVEIRMPARTDGFQCIASPSAANVSVTGVPSSAYTVSIQDLGLDGLGRDRFNYVVAWGASAPLQTIGETRYRCAPEPEPEPEEPEPPVTPPVEPPPVGPPPGETFAPPTP